MEASEMQFGKVYEWTIVNGFDKASQTHGEFMQTISTKVRTGFGDLLVFENAEADFFILSSYAIENIQEVK